MLQVAKTVTNHHVPNVPIATRTGAVTEGLVSALCPHMHAKVCTHVGRPSVITGSGQNRNCAVIMHHIV